MPTIMTLVFEPNIPPPPWTTWDGTNNGTSVTVGTSNLARSGLEMITSTQGVVYYRPDTAETTLRRRTFTVSGTSITLDPEEQDYNNWYEGGEFDIIKDADNPSGYYVVGIKRIPFNDRDLLAGYRNLAGTGDGVLNAVTEIQDGSNQQTGIRSLLLTDTNFISTIWQNNGPGPYPSVGITGIPPAFGSSSVPTFDRTDYFFNPLSTPYINNTDGYCISNRTGATGNVKVWSLSGTGNGIFTDEANQSGIVTTDGNNNLVRVNDNAYVMFGYTAATDILTANVITVDPNTYAISTGTPVTVGTTTSYAASAVQVFSPEPNLAVAIGGGGDCFTVTIDPNGPSVTSTSQTLGSYDGTGFAIGRAARKVRAIPLDDKRTLIATYTGNAPRTIKLQVLSA